MTDSSDRPVTSQVRRPRRHKPKRPEKPTDDFPLFPHYNGLWAKKIRGRLHYFGPWREDRNGEAAIKKYLEQKEDLHAGRTPRAKTEEPTIRDLVNRFLTHKRHLLDNHEISGQYFQDCYLTCERIVKSFGRERLFDDIGPDDFESLRVELAKKWGPVRLGNTIQRVRSVFKFAHDTGLVEKPIRYGAGFKRPSKKVLRQQRAKNGIRMFEADEIHKMLAKAGIQLKAMILLGVNAGLGNTDCGSLELRHLDLDGGWLNYPRPKTGINRRVKLWPETIAAIRNALANRPKQQDDSKARLVFLTQRGGSWVKVYTTEQKQDDGTHILRVHCDDSVSKETAKILKKLGISGRRNFYALRHTLETIAGSSRDQVAVDHIMGHARDDMASAYRERIEDNRLADVASHVRRWLFGENSDKDGN